VDPVPVVEQYYVGVLSEKGWQVTKYPGVPADWMGDGGEVVIATASGRHRSFPLDTTSTVLCYRNPLFAWGRALASASFAGLTKARRSRAA